MQNKKVKSLAVSSNLRKERHLEDRKRTEEHCANLTAESERQIQTGHENLQERWLQAFEKTVPQEIRDQMLEIKGLNLYFA